MAVKIRLTRIGRHKDPIYRIVAADSKYSRDGRFIEHVGYYDPSKGIENATVNEEAILRWIAQGAQYSDTIKAILTEKGLIEKAKSSKSGNNKKSKVNKTACPKDEEALKKEKQAKSLAKKEAALLKAQKKQEKEEKLAKEAEKAEETVSETVGE